VRGPERLDRGGAAAQSPAFARGGSLPGARIDVAAAARSTDVAARRIRLPGCGSRVPPWAARSPVGGEDDGGSADPPPPL